MHSHTKALLYGTPWYDDLLSVPCIRRTHREPNRLISRLENGDKRVRQLSPPSFAVVGRARRTLCFLRGSHLSRTRYSRSICTLVSVRFHRRLVKAQTKLDDAATEAIAICRRGSPDGTGGYGWSSPYSEFFRYLFHVQKTRFILLASPKVLNKPFTDKLWSGPLVHADRRAVKMGRCHLHGQSTYP